jgi:predicted ArsR family transcriptional regulator
MSVWDTLMDAIKGLPEATVLRAHVAFLRDQFTAMERKAKDLEAEKHDLELDKANLQQQVRDLQEQLSTRRRDRLEPLKEGILKLLISSHLTHLDIANRLNINSEIALTRLEKMQEDELVDTQNYQLSQGESPIWHVEPKGRQYLVEHSLIQ